MNEFIKKNDCKKYIEQSGDDNIWMFEKDINVKMSHTFIATTYQKIYDSIINGNNSYYESIDNTRPVKLFFDYDNKIDISSDNKKMLEQLEDKSHIYDIQELIKRIRIFFPDNEIIILKSIPDHTKKSYHIIVCGAYFKNVKLLKSFVKENFTTGFETLVSTNIIDMSVYSSKCLRMVMCTKYEQCRPLFMLRTNTFINELREEIVQNISYETFLKCCICHIEDGAVEYKYKEQKKKKEHNIKGDVFTERDVIMKYIDLLDSSRYTDRNKWLNIGYILYSIDRSYIDIWHYFSKRWDNYKEQDCNIAWESFANNEQKYTIHNLMHLASIDSPKEYAELCKDIPNHDIKYMRPYDNVISKVIYRMYGSEFICSDPQENEWYFFNGTRWNKENKNYNLRKRTINEVFNKVENYRRSLIKENASEEVIKTYNQILKILGNGVKMNCLELEFYNSKFSTIIDQNDDLIGFDNGIYDLKTMEFRKGVCSDYISMSTHYDFVKIPTNHPDYIRLEQLIEKIFPDPELRLYQMKSLSSCLDGHTRDEKFYIWSGKHHSGGNGKTTITDLALKTLGDYGCMSPVTLMTGKQTNASNSNSALASIKNKRLVIMQEPGANDIIQAGLMKNYTGGDEVSTRDLFKTQITFKIKAKFFLCCNIIPSISSIDGGVSRRLLITEFTTRFVDNPSPEVHNGIHEFQIDRELKSILPNYKNVFMNMLLNYYILYRAEGLNPPEIVTSVTRKYENDNNAIKQFADEKLQQTTLRGLFVSKEQLRDEYNKDPVLKQAFGKFSSFLIQIENIMCSEFRKDRNGKYRLEGWCLKSDDLYSDDTDLIDV